MTEHYSMNNKITEYNIVRVKKNDRTLSYELQNNREQYHIS